MFSDTFHPCKSLISLSARHRRGRARPGSSGSRYLLRNPPHITPSLCSAWALRRPRRLNSASSKRPSQNNSHLGYLGLGRLRLCYCWGKTAGLNHRFICFSCPLKRLEMAICRVKGSSPSLHYLFGFLCYVCCWGLVALTLAKRVKNSNSCAVLCAQRPSICRPGI